MNEPRDTAQAIAAALVPVIEPMLARRLEAARRAAMKPLVRAAGDTSKPAAPPLPANILAAAMAVGDAAEQLNQVRYTSAARRARVELEKRALALSLVLGRSER